jgi:hypothetical protein
MIGYHNADRFPLKDPQSNNQKRKKQLFLDHEHILTTICWP